MEFRHLRAFAAVATSLSLSRASELMFISQPALSRQIRDLEDELGVSLFTRHFNGMRLTSAGEVFYTQARDIIARADAAIKEVAIVRESASSAISLGLDPLVPLAPLYTMVNRFKGLHPHVALKIREDTSARLHQELMGNNVDFCLTVGDRSEHFPKVETFELRRVQLCLFLDTPTFMDRQEHLSEFLPLHTLLYYHPSAAPGDLELPFPELQKVLGFRPGMTRRLSSPAIIGASIIAREGYSIGPPDTFGMLPEHPISCIPIPVAGARLLTSASWRTGECSGALLSLLTICKNTL